MLTTRHGFEGHVSVSGSSIAALGYMSVPLVMVMSLLRLRGGDSLLL